MKAPHLQKVRELFLPLERYMHILAISSYIINHLFL